MKGTEKNQKLFFQVLENPVCYVAKRASIYISISFFFVKYFSFFREMVCISTRYIFIYILLFFVNSCDITSPILFILSLCPLSILCTSLCVHGHCSQQFLFPYATLHAHLLTCIYITKHVFRINDASLLI